MVRVRITHPFHPLFNHEIVRVAEHCSRHGDRIWYERLDGSVASIPRAWTDQAVPDPFAVVAAGKAHFRPEGLAELAQLLASIREGRPSSGGCDGV